MMTMFGAKEGHTIFCDETCSVAHHEVLMKLIHCKRNDMRTFEVFKECVLQLVAEGWDVNSEIPDSLKHFRFPLVHWAAVYGKLAVLKWLTEQDFDLAITNTSGENAMHRLVACQAHERALDPRAINGTKVSGSRRYSLLNITQVFSKVTNILTDARPQMLLWYDFVERNTPLQLCLKLLMEADNQKLALYHEAVFKILCERLIELVKKEKLSSEYVRNALSLKDSIGNTLWHTAAKTKDNKIIGAVSLLLSTIKDIDLCCTNSNGDTPCIVALRHSFTQFASMIEEHKSPTLVIPMVKMETTFENIHCHCDPKGNLEYRDDVSLNYQDFVEGPTNTSYIQESSPATLINSRQPSFCITEEQSFTDAPQQFTMIDLQKVVLTDPASDGESVGQLRSASTELVLNCSTSSTLNECTETSSEADRYLTKSYSNNNIHEDSSTQGDILIEKQIDLVVSVTPSPDTSVVSPVDQQPCVMPNSKENSDITDKIMVLIQRNSCSSNMECDSEVTPPKNHRPKLNKSSPPVAESTMSDVREGETSTPPNGSVERGVNLNLTPVLLIKLLSEPDVSEKFQSLLKDVISGDCEKVDSAQSTLEKLGNSKARLDGEITQSEQNLRDIDAKKGLLNEAISKLRLKLGALDNLEKDELSNITNLKEERNNIAYRMKECESTCNHLKRRLSDCTGALNGLSPKQQKTQH